jgi:hypothetical protein
MPGYEAAAEKSIGPKGELFDLKNSALSVGSVNFKSILDIAVQCKKFMRNAGSTLTQFVNR